VSHTYRSVLVFAAVVALGSACSSGSSNAQKDSASASSSARTSSVASGSASASPELCRAFQSLSDTSTSAGALDLNDWSNAQKQIAALSSALDDAWEHAIARLSGDLKNDAQTVKAYTDKTFALAAQVSSAADWTAGLETDPDTQPAGQAAQRVDQFAVSACGVNPAGTPGGPSSSGN